MTTQEMYNVTVEEFVIEVECTISRLLSEGYTPGKACIFAVIFTEIHYLQLHLEKLRQIPLPQWREHMADAVALQKKLDNKHTKLRRYKKELL